MTTPVAVIRDTPEPVVDLNLKAPSRGLDAIFGDVTDSGDLSGGNEYTEGIDSQPISAPTVAPTAPAAPVAPVVASSRPDALSDVPASLLKLDAPAAPVAPVAPVTPPEDHAAADAAYDKQTELTASRFSNAEQKKAFYEVRKEAKEHKLQAREAQQKIASYEQRIKDAEASAKKIAESQVQAAVQPTVELQGKIVELEKQIGTYEDRLGKLDLQQSDGFQRQFELPLKAAESRLAKLLTGGHRDAEAAAALARDIVSQTDRDTQLSMLAEDPVPVQGAIVNVLADMAEIKENRQIAVDNWKASRAFVSEEQKRASTTAFIHDVYANTDAAINTLTQEGNFLLSQVPENEQWNGAVANRINAARGILQSGDAKTLVKYVVDGVTAADTRALYIKLVQAYTKLKNEASAVMATAPVLGGGAVVVTAPAPVRPKSGEELLQRTFGNS